VRVGSLFVVQPVAASAARVLIPRQDLGNITVEFQMPSSITSPLPAGTPLGTVLVRDGARIIGQVQALYPQLPMTTGKRLPDTDLSSISSATQGVPSAAHDAVGGAPR
jgi:hypothetical protein